MRDKQEILDDYDHHKEDMYEGTFRRLLLEVLCDTRDKLEGAARGLRDVSAGVHMEAQNAAAQNVAGLND